MNKFLFKYAVYFFLLLIAGCTSDYKFNNSKILNDYPSGSGITYLNDRIYLIGDDASYILITDTAFKSIDSIGFIGSLQKRIPKELKPDLEGLTVVSINKLPQILLVGSGSLMPYRNSGWLINPINKQKTELDLNTFYNRLRKEGMDALNIEGVATIPRGIVLASRGNKSFRENYLIFTANEFWDNQDSVEIRKCKVGTNTDTASFQGVSGLEYSKASDQLLLTVSTENTNSATEDGIIGKSYLWIINNISAKRNMIALNPGRIIELEALDGRFKGHKIESVCIVSENKKKMEIVLVADDDKGTSILFNITLKK
ncbi:MAG TPA: hypothetical protein VMY77_13970 [Chitinophagaceae bacterium]|nr:hypothetical protein [Chitinophagaceae bacterium]